MTKQAKQRIVVVRNFVAKNAQRSGAGTHQDKEGPRASRARQKANYLKELRDGK